MAQRNIVLLLLLTVFISQFIFAQSDTLTLGEIEIASAKNPVRFKELSRSIILVSKEEIEMAPINSVDDILKYYGGMDIRSRGPMGIQSDISIRGGSFDQNLIMINGMPLNDPQTGHHSLNLPVMFQIIEKIEILEGSGARWFGANAYSGGINIITSPTKENDLNVSLRGGQHQFMGFALHSNYQLGSVSNSTSAGWTSSKGYITNTDFKMWQLSHQSVYTHENHSLALQLGYLNKAFGANSFYTPKYPDQFEQLRNTFASLNYEVGKNLRLKTSLYWRRLNDRFELFREDSDWYIKKGDVYVNGSDTAGFPSSGGLVPYKGHNYHRTDVWGAEANLSFTSKLGKTSTGISFRNEHIFSNVLGLPMGDTLAIRGETDGFYTHSKARQNYNAYLEHAFVAGRFTLSGGMSLFLNNDYGFHFSPGVDLGYFVTKKLKWFATANKAIRLPTYTDLYYQGPDHISNPDLKAEKALSVESGFKYFNGGLLASASAFYRIGSNSIDWVKPSVEAKWESKNITDLNTLGVSLSVIYSSPSNSLSFTRYLGVRYTYLQADKSAGAFISLYALDYLRHHLNLLFAHRISRKFSASWTLALQQRNGSYVDYSSSRETSYDFVHLFNGKVQYSHRNLMLYVEASNILNQKYVDLGNIEQPGIWIMGGVDFKLSFAGH